MLSLVTHWARIDDTQLGRPKLSGQEAANPLAVPMMLLYVIDEVCREDDELRQAYTEDEEWAVQQILKHLQVNCTNWRLQRFWLSVLKTKSKWTQVKHTRSDSKEVPPTKWDNYL